MSEARASENGYTRRHPLGLMVQAQTLETVAGYTSEQVLREIAFATAALDVNHPATMEWLACLLERRIADLAAAKVSA